MNEASPAQDNVLAVLALNILCGNLKPEQWIGLRRVDPEEAEILDAFNDVRRKKWGRLEASVVDSHLDTIFKSETYKWRNIHH